MDQLSLRLKDAGGAYLTHTGLSQADRTEPWSMTPQSLRDWGDRVHRFQAEVRDQPQVEQVSLFELETPTLTVLGDSGFDPFTVRPQSFDFWCWEQEGEGAAAIYFVLDLQWPILLYVGESGNHHQRWKREHDCKEYVRRYVNAHHALGLQTQVVLGFELGVPERRKARQALEQAFIQRWRSPFNKENWNYWKTPFVN
ncbi:MAG: GIY-YIG nuclease family protein [Prochlorothrix sp.]